VRRVAAGGLEAFTASVLERLGAPPAHAARVAGLLVRADLGGHESHGVRLLSVYAASIRDGITDPAAAPVVAKDSGTTLIVDGRRSFGQLSAALAVELAASRARLRGLAAVAVRDGCHVGRLADYAEQAAAAGAIAIVAANDAGTSQVVVPYGGTEPRLATNPLAIGIPRAGAPHLVVDMATSVAAHGIIRVRERRGEEVPPEWRSEGALQPLGGAKGTGLALAVDVLAGILTGTGFSHDPGERPDLQGFFVVALDPWRFVQPERFEADVEALVAWVKTAPPAPGFDEVLVPGESAARAAARNTQEGVPVDDATWSELAALAEELGIPLPTTQEVTDAP
jgi:LDH2 family malate/lactate/ureidoglycolate dehydrogenase